MPLPRVLRAIAAVGLAVGLGEALSALVSLALPPLGGAAASVEAELEFGGGARKDLNVLHPFLGTVLDPAGNSEGLTAFHGVPISGWGFLDEREPIVRRSAERFVVGIFGGSVAFWTSTQGWEALRAELARTREVEGREIVPVRVALGGYKQPQQALALDYLYASGAEFDLVINIDGVNEVLLAIENQVPQGVTLSFPRGWPDLLGEVGGIARARALGRATLAAEEIRRWDRRRRTAWYRWSPTARLAMQVAANRERQRLARARAELEQGRRDLGFAARGPLPPPTGRADALRASAAIWSRSARSMAGLAQERGAAFLHVLQPNQYLTGSKPMDSSEVQTALAKDASFGVTIREGYAELSRQTPEFSAPGAKFVDLTGIFRSVRAPRYRDACCHLTVEGSVELGKAVGIAARELLEGRPVAGPSEASNP